MRRVSVVQNFIIIFHNKSENRRTLCKKKIETNKINWAINEGVKSMEVQCKDIAKLQTILFFVWKRSLQKPLSLSLPQINLALRVSEIGFSHKFTQSTLNKQSKWVNGKCKSQIKQHKSTKMHWLVQLIYTLIDTSFNFIKSFRKIDSGFLCHLTADKFKCVPCTSFIYSCTLQMIRTN